MGKEKLKFAEQTPLPGGPEQPKSADMVQSPQMEPKIFPECFTGVNFDGIGISDRKLVGGNPSFKATFISAGSILQNANAGIRADANGLGKPSVRKSTTATK